VEYTPRIVEEKDSNKGACFIEVEWCVNNFRVGRDPDPQFPTLRDRDCLRVTGKCQRCNAFFDICNDYVDEDISKAMIVLFCDTVLLRINPEEPWPYIIKGRPGIMFVTAEQTEAQFITNEKPEQPKRNNSNVATDHQIYRQKLLNIQTSGSVAFDPRKFVVRLISSSDAVNQGKFELSYDKYPIGLDESQ
jgi:hypothetical protein